jgi:hypothetical protein
MQHQVKVLLPEKRRWSLQNHCREGRVRYDPAIIAGSKPSESPSLQRGVFRLKEWCVLQMRDVDSEQWRMKPLARMKELH